MTSIKFNPKNDLTKQSMEKETNINNIMDAYLRKGIELPTTVNAVYADVTGLDFETAMNVVAQANTDFNELPANIRDALGHDVSRYVDFIDERASEIAENGLDNELLSLIAEPENVESSASEAVEAEISANSDSTSEEVEK